jgi:hypothetical protein
MSAFDKTKISVKDVSSPAGLFINLIKSIMSETIQVLIPIMCESIEASIGRKFDEEANRKDLENIYLTKKEAAAFIKRSESTIDRWRKDGKIQFKLNANGRPVFLKNSLLLVK